MLLRLGIKRILVLFLLCVFIFGSFSIALAETNDIVDLDEPLKLNIELKQLSMADAIKLALLNNPRVSIERSIIEEKEWSITEEKSYLYPQLYVSQNFMSSNNPVQAFMMRLNQRNLVFSQARINTPGTKNNFSTRLGAMWTIFDRSIYKKVNISKLELEIQKQLGRKAVNKLVYDVRKAYLNVMVAQSRIDNAIADYTYSESHYKSVKDKKELGEVSKSDLFAAKVKIASSKEQLLKAKNDLNLAWIVLADLLADDSIVGFDLVDKMKESFEADDIDKLVKYSYLHSPLISAVEARKEKSVLDLELAKKTGAITLKAQGEWGVDTILDDRDIARSFTAGVFLNKSLFDGFLKKAKVKKAKANITKSNAEIDQVYRNVKVEVVQHYLSFKNALERLQMTNDMVSDSEESLRAYNERYSVGLSTNVEVQAAQSKFVNSKMLRTHALYDLNLCVIELQKFIGMPIADIIASNNLVVTSKSIDNLNDKLLDDPLAKPEPKVEPVKPESKIEPEPKVEPVKPESKIEPESKVEPAKSEVNQSRLIKKQNGKNLDDKTSDTNIFEDDYNEISPDKEINPILQKQNIFEITPDDALNINSSLNIEIKKENNMLKPDNNLGVKLLDKTIVEM